MGDLISREEAIALIREQGIKGNGYDDVEREEDVVDMLESLPTVEAKEVVHGEWVNEYINRYGHPCHCCSVCGFHASHQDKNFCPECGADMRKKV